MALYAKLVDTDHAIKRIIRIVKIDRILNKEDLVDITIEVPAPKVGWFYADGLGFSESLPAVAITKSRKVISDDFFYGLLTTKERGKVFALMEADGGGISLTMIKRGRLKAWVMLSISNGVSLEHHETVWVINAMETAGVLAAGRAAEILGQRV